MITFSHDTIHRKFNKWDDTIHWTTCGWTNPEVQSGRVLLSVNTGDNIDRIRTESRQKTTQTSTENRRKIDTKPSKHRQKINTK